MIKHLSPKSEEELAQVKLNEQKDIVKFAKNKIKHFKKLPDEVTMDVRPDYWFQNHTYGYRKWRLFYPHLKDVYYYEIKFKRSKSGKWRVIAVVKKQSNMESAMRESTEN